MSSWTQITLLADVQAQLPQRRPGPVKTLRLRLVRPGDIETDEYGEGHERFVGRFNEETFIVAPGVAPAPLVHNNAFPDASPNPQTGPIQTYHLGLWFNSPKDAVKAGCSGGVTPFNGEHNAGIQVLNTSQFKDAQGPLFNVKP